MKRKLFAVLLLAALLPLVAAAESAGTQGIVGSDVQALLKSLEELGIRTPEPENEGSLSVWEAEDAYIDGIESSYKITANNAGEVVRAHFSMDGKNGLLSCAAAMQYDAAAPDRAAKFVKSNLGKQKSTIIGDAEFSLDAGDGLLITASGMHKYKIYTLDIVQNDALTSGEGVIARVVKNVNIRAEDNSDSARVGSASAGDELLVTVPYYSEKWHQINYNGQICYVSAGYCELEGVEQ